MNRPRGLFLAAVFLFVACGQNYNSNSGDAVYGDKGLVIDTSDPKQVLFGDAYNLIKERCISCHSSYHTGWAKYKATAEWKQAGLISDNVSSSKIINKLINNGGNMPLGGSKLPDADYKKLTDWIESQ